MLKPKRLLKGDTVAVISPCFATPAERLPDILKAIENLGLKARLGKYVTSVTEGYCASPYERAEDFNYAVRDKNVKMILFDGGEVCNEILPLIDYAAIAENPKIICSYSDGTSLLDPITTKTGLVTYYGQGTLSTLYSQYNRECFKSAFFDGGVPAYKTAKGFKKIYGGKASGRLIGGYLLNFSLLCGNPYFTFDGNIDHILFFEDNIAFNGAPAVSRYISNIEQSGLWKSVKGIIVGNYSNTENKEFDSLLNRFANKWRLPFIKCDDFGHGEFQAILPIGIECEINADRGTVEFKESFTK